VGYTYQYPRPALTVDAAIFRKMEFNWEILLIQRKNPPFKHGWALPGGFVDMDETLEKAITRELEEETSLINIELKQLHAFSTPGRDPRGHTISVVFWGIISNHQVAKAGDDAANVKWFNIDKLPKLAFDHDEVIETATQILK
jgi:8-oxo-dGTP diphosphatase